MQYRTEKGIDEKILRELDNKIQSLVDRILSEKVDEISVQTFLFEASELFNYGHSNEIHNLISYLYTNYHDLYLQIHEYLPT